MHSTGSTVLAVWPTCLPEIFRYINTKRPLLRNNTGGMSGAAVFPVALRMVWQTASPETLKKYGAVSRETAREMVKGVLSLTKADIAVAVTGIAGPSSDDTNKSVGLVYIAVSDGKSTIVKKLLNNFTDDVREQNRSISADTALEMIMEAIR